MNSVNSANLMVKPLVDKISELRKNLEQLEKSYECNLEKKEKKMFIEDRKDYKLDHLLSYQDKSDQIKIDASGTIFETTLKTIKNCRYKNILKDMIEEGSFLLQDDAIFLDIDGSHFEVILEIIRFTQINPDQNRNLEKLGKYPKNFYSDFNQFYEDDKCPKLIKKFRTYNCEEKLSDICLIETIKLFFYEDSETIFNDLNINNYDPNAYEKFKNKYQLANETFSNPATEK
jgi:hypothetical protein